MGGEYELQALSVPESIEDLHELIARAGRDHPDVNRDDLMMLETAVIEIVGNVVEHALPLGRVTYRCRLEVLDDALRVHLIDRGLGIVPWPPTEPDPLAESGRGLHLARALVHKLEYERIGDENRWVVERRRT